MWVSAVEMLIVVYQVCVTQFVCVFTVMHSTAAYVNYFTLKCTICPPTSVQWNCHKVVINNCFPFGSLTHAFTISGGRTVVTRTPENVIQ